MIELRFSCSGCGAKADGTGPMRREFYSFTGKSHGFGTWRWATTPDMLAPDGWIAADPYTNVTYCGPCWQSIIDGTCDKEAAR